MNAPKETEQTSLVALLSLPAVSAAIWDSLAENIDVQERAALLLIARYKKQATLFMENGDIVAVKDVIADAKKILAAAPGTSAAVPPPMARGQPGQPPSGCPPAAEPPSRSPRGGIAEFTASQVWTCLFYTSPTPREQGETRMPSSG